LRGDVPPKEGVESGELRVESGANSGGDFTGANGGNGEGKFHI
jgi:hypothetical protein